MDQFSRTELVLGAAAVAHLKTCRVAIFGVGGVGGYAAEALVRSGVGAIALYDDDRVCLTNLNRQLIATRKTVGQYKVDAMEPARHQPQRRNSHLQNVLYAGYRRSGGFDAV